MKIHVLSDLHLESLPPAGVFSPPRVEADLVILAGDIHAVGVNGADWAISTFTQPTILIAGNHEFYDGCPIDVRIRDLRNACEGSNVRFLECESTTLGEVRILGATAWTSMGQGLQSQLNDAERTMTDFGVIRIDDARFAAPQDLLLRHKDAIRWLEVELATPFSGKTIVVTHHMPTLRAIHPKYRDHPINVGFASDLEWLMNGVDLWVFGHTHASWLGTVGRCQCVCNPRGVPELPGKGNPEFDPSLVVEI